MRTRERLLKIFNNTRTPLSEAELRIRLSVNKTTIYRALEQLKAESLIKEVNFSDGKMRFELSSLPHHHHLMCLDCHRIEDMVLKDELRSIEQTIAKDKKFQVKNHNLEFFGVCNQCS
jgi:Fur family ferric uptake transcriptional regulator